MKTNEPPPPALTDRFQELVKLLIEAELSRSERAELQRELRNSATARSFLAEALAESTLRAVRVRSLSRDSVRLSS